MTKEQIVKNIMMLDDTKNYDELMACDIYALAIYMSHLMGEVA